MSGVKEYTGLWSHSGGILQQTQVDGRLEMPGIKKEEKRREFYLIKLSNVKSTLLFPLDASLCCVEIYYSIPFCVIFSLLDFFPCISLGFL